MNKVMTFLAAAASLAIASVASSATAYAGAVLDNVLATKTLKVAAGTDWGPMSHMNDKHELDGSDIDIAKAIADYLGVKVEFVTPAWDIMTAGRWEGRWDIAMGEMAPLKARSEKLDFPAVYVYGRVSAVVHKDSKANKLSDLDGKVVGATASTVSESYANHTLAPDWIVGGKPIDFQFKPREVKAYATHNVALDDLRLGDGVRLDAVIGDETVTRDAIKAGYPLKEIGVVLTTPGAVAILRGDKEFSEKIAAAIKAMKDDGTLAKIMVKWYGVDRSVEK